MGPLIVDVISASEGAKEYYIGDKMPNILKGNKDTVEKNKEDGSQKKTLFVAYLGSKQSYSAGDKVPNLLFNESKKPVSKDTAVVSISNPVYFGAV